MSKDKYLIETVRQEVNSLSDREFFNQLFNNFTKQLDTLKKSEEADSSQEPGKPQTKINITLVFDKRNTKGGLPDGFVSFIRRNYYLQPLLERDNLSQLIIATDNIHLRNLFSNLNPKINVIGLEEI